MTVKLLLAEKPTIYLKQPGGTVAVPTYGTGPPGATGAPGATGPPGSSGGPVPGGTATDGFLVVKDTATAGLARYQDPATSALLLAKYVSKDALTVSVKDHGAVGDGVTNDTTAINNSVTAAGTGGTVFFPHGVYAVSSSLTFGSVRLEGPGATIKKIGSSVANWLTVSGGSTAPEFLGLDFDANSLVTSVLFNFAAGATTDAFIEQCSMRNASASAVGLRLRDGVTDLKVHDLLIDGIYQGVYVDGTVTSPVLDDVRIKNWVQRGMYIVGDATHTTTDARVTNCKVTDMAAGGTVRQPIAFEGDDAAQHLRTRVNNNLVIGPNKSWTAVDPGTADNIGMHRCNGFEVIGNQSYYGGDCGMAIAAQCENGVIADNVCMYNDTPGLAIGAASTTFIRNIAVTGNTFVNNGQARNSDRVNGRVGLWLDTADHIEVNGNVFADNQGTPTTQYGTYINGCTNIDFGHNTFNGLAVASHSFGASASVNITGTVTAPYVLTTPVTVGPSATGPTTIWSPTAWPLGTYVAGKTVLDLDLAGTIDCKATSGNFSAKILVNTVVVATIVVAATQTGANTNVNWNARAKIYVDTLGASGAISCVGAVVAPAAGGATWTTSTVGTYGTVVNLTTGLAVTVQLSMGTADALNINRLNKAILRPAA